MATIEPYETKAGTRYRVRYRTPDRRDTTKRGFLTKKSAQQFAAETQLAIADGTYISPTVAKRTVTSIYPDWEHGQQQLSTRSQRNNKSAWNVHVKPKWGDWPVGKITKPEIEKWITELQTTKGRDTIKRALHVLSSILDTAVDVRSIKTNPAVQIKIKRELRPRRDYLTVLQVDTLATATDVEQYQTLIYVLAYCGPRINEATALDVGDFNPTTRRLSITKAVKGPGEIGPTKTYEHRNTPVPKFIAKQLEKLVKGRKRDAPLFTSPEGHRLDADNYRVRTFKAQLKAAQTTWNENHPDDSAGFPTITPHSLRHTCASMAISAGANPLAVQKLLGHENASVTLGTYADLFPDDLDQVADMLDQLHDQANFK